MSRTNGQSLQRERNPSVTANKLTTQFEQTDVEVFDRQVVRKGFLSIVAWQLRHRLFQGGWSQPMHREVMERGHAVVVIPYDPARDQLVLLQQFRAGMLEQPESPWLFEFVAGMIDAQDHDEAAVARRELWEEAGLEAQQLQAALSYYSSPGGCSEKISIYLAHVDASQAADFAGLATEHEDIKVHVVPREQALTMLAEGQINNAATVIGLQWLQLRLMQAPQAAP